MSGTFALRPPQMSIILLGRSMRQLGMEIALPPTSCAQSTYRLEAAISVYGGRAHSLGRLPAARTEEAVSLAR